MNDNRITSLGAPKSSADAVTKRWVNQQMKDGMKDLEELDSEMKQMRMDIKQMQKEYEASIKDLTKNKVDKSECVSTNGGLMTTDLDMQKYHVLNLPLPQTDNEPITKALYDRLQQDLDALRVFVELKHT